MATSLIMLAPPGFSKVEIAGRTFPVSGNPATITVPLPFPDDALASLKVLGFKELQTVEGAVVATPSLTDISITSLSAGQAVGTVAVAPLNPARKFFAITPSKEGRLYIGDASGARTNFFWPLFAGITKTIDEDTPTNALFVTGQPAGQPLPMAEG